MAKLSPKLDYERDYLIGELYQLISSIEIYHPGLIPDADKWMDNLAAAKVIHKDLLPVCLKELETMEE